MKRSSITIRVSQDLREAIESVAKKADITSSEVVRRLIDRHLPREVKKEDYPLTPDEAFGPPDTEGAKENIKKARREKGLQELAFQAQELDLPNEPMPKKECNHNFKFKGLDRVCTKCGYKKENV